MYYKIENLNKSFENRQILKNINIEIEKGQIVALIGKSGIGKSTLFNIMSGFENLDSGKIFLKGENITYKKKNIAYMTQKDLLLQHLTVFENLILVFKLKNIISNNIRVNILNALKSFNLIEYKDFYPNQLSGGMKQKVTFLRTCLTPNDLLLLDEPFSKLDLITKQSIYTWFKSVTKKMDNTIIFITHDIQEAIFLANKVIVLSQNPAVVKQTFFIDKSLNSSIQLNQDYTEIYNNILKSLI